MLDYSTLRGTCKPPPGGLFHEPAERMANPSGIRKKPSRILFYPSGIQKNLSGILHDPSGMQTNPFRILRDPSRRLFHPSGRVAGPSRRRLHSSRRVFHLIGRLGKLVDEALLPCGSVAGRNREARCRGSGFQPRAFVFICPAIRTTPRSNNTTIRSYGEPPLFSGGIRVAEQLGGVDRRAVMGFMQRGAEFEVWRCAAQRFLEGDH